MPSYTCGLAKGLKEPVSPYREDYAFGAALGDFDANNWNAIPTLWDPNTSFDLTGISINHEVVVVRIGISNTNEGGTLFNFKWYNEDTGKLLYSSEFGYNCFEEGYVYAYSYIGWLAEEINANGNYSCVIDVTGAHEYSKTLKFTVLGIPSGYHSSGYIWVEGQYFHYTDSSGVERRIQGTAL